MANKKREEGEAKSKKGNKHTSSFMSTSRCDGSLAPTLRYIQPGLKECPSVGKYTPRNIGVKNSPMYSFSKKKRDTHIFLFSKRAGSHTLFDGHLEYANFEKLINSKHAMEPQYYRSFKTFKTRQTRTILKSSSCFLKNTTIKSRVIFTSKSGKRNKVNKKSDFQLKAISLQENKPKSARTRIR